MPAYSGTLNPAPSRHLRTALSGVALALDERRNEEIESSHLDTPVGQNEAPYEDNLKDVYEFNIVSNRLDFESLEDDWNLLFDRHGQPHQVFLTFNWCWHWCTQFLGSEFSNQAPDEAIHTSQKSRLFVVTARRNGELVMVWPLLRDTKYGITRLSWLSGNVSQYGDVVVADMPDKAKVLRDGWDYIIANGNCDVVSLSKVRDDSNIYSTLASSGVVVEAEEFAPYLKLGETTSVDAYFKSKSSKAAKNRRRARRRLEERGKVSFEVLKPGRQAREIAIKALELKRQWLKNSGQFSRALSDPRTDQFFSDIALGEQRDVGTRISKLSVDGHEVAIEIGFECKGSLAVHIIVYDNDFNKFSCGSLAMEDSIRACWNDGFSTYDLLAPRAPYKMEWADQTMAVKDWHKPISVRGQIWLGLYHFAGKQSIKRVVNCLPMVVRQPVTQLISRLCRKSGV